MKVPETSPPQKYATNLKSNTNMNKTVFIKCTCHSEGIMIEADEDSLYLSIWERGYKDDNSFTWKQKLRYIWQILKHGKPYGDQIVLDRGSCFALSRALIEHAPQG